MKNMIALLIGMTLLTACGKQVGKDANSPIPLPPIGGGYDENPPATIIDMTMEYPMANAGVSVCVKAGCDFGTEIKNDASVLLPYSGKLEINDLYSNETNLPNSLSIKLNGDIKCHLTFNGSEYVSTDEDGYIVDNCLSFNVLKKDILSVEFKDSVLIGGIKALLTYRQ